MLIADTNVNKSPDSMKIHPAESELSRDWRLMKAYNKKKLSSLNSDTRYPKGYPFVEEPLRFHFHDDYGTRQFHELRIAILYENLHKQMLVVSCERDIRGMKYSDDEIYNLSSEKDMIDSFMEENLL